MCRFIFCLGLVIAGLLFNSAPARAADCSELPNHEMLRTALIASRLQANGGLNLNMWGTIVDRAGIVCAVAFTGVDFDDQWPGSRVISAQKAFTANAFSLDALALSTANLYSAVQPGGSLYGLQFSNPVDTDIAYRGPSGQYGTDNDPMENDIVGGINVFGGGLALYNITGQVIGGLGVSGDTSCADHNIAWRTRNALGLDYVPGGVASGQNDQIIYDIIDDRSAGGFGHPGCRGAESEIAARLPPTRIPAPVVTP